ncbi:MAG TPA: hybrid sensor histidine kinase/response regulator [Tenuifilaceae bacterium]|nr:hybrid sensor histidine kinase/response regulator [Tenuifilaceae bacterium]HPE19332.1 hybrid sensor histidine kinase/response regulator [Tenuifilaceae bacterium]HPQ35341.1 hybrid sensor histidine kinase/response regulator [Tenuifilaceae bacterium]HRX69129.1 hybrid sensor histidine kinase/response regulator [Tenuifilaceae bacterium]
MDAGQKYRELQLQVQGSASQGSSSPSFSILYVDDDEENLIGFESVFSKTYQVTTAVNAESAYNLMKIAEYGVVLVDYKMPGEDGISFVERVRNEFPDTVFVIVSAWADVDVVIKAINMHCFYGFVQKPWNHHELGITLRNAFDAFHSKIENRRLSMELEERNCRLLESIEREREANNLKNIFLQNISHEVRTPLNSIIGFTNLILSASDDETIHSYATFVSQAGYQLLSTIHGILEASVIFCNKLVLNKNTFDLRNCIINICNEYSHEANNKGLQLVNNISSSVILKNDELKISQIISELVGNAIKFTEKGSVTVDSLVANENMLVIRVNDSGVGIEPKKIKQVFEPFRQSDESSTRKYNGNGVGLFIAKSYAEFLGGELWVESKLNEGSTFHLFLKREV